MPLTMALAFCAACSTAVGVAPVVLSASVIALSQQAGARGFTGKVGAMSQKSGEQATTEDSGSSPVGRGGAGTYIEGELGAFYLLQMLAGSCCRASMASAIRGRA